MVVTGPYTEEEVETVKRLYPDHFTYEIAEVLDRSIKSVEGKIEKLKLTGRPASSTIRKLRKWKECEEEYGIPIKDLLFELHWKLELPIRNGMDKALKTNPKSVTDWMKDLGVSHRSISEDNKRRYSLMTEAEIKAQTLAAHEAIRKNGQPSNIGRPGWSQGLTKYDHPGLMISSEKHIGENNPMWGKRGAAHPQWTGGEKYWKHKEWFEIRDQVRLRDNYTCQDCGLKEEESYNLYNSPLQVHHIIPYQVCKKHEPDNLITLCLSCHSKADGNLGEGKWKQKELSVSKEAGRKQSSIFRF